jgi:hypothetical protein
LATFNAIFAKVQGAVGVPNDCEIWIQGPEPSATKIADASTAAYPANVVNGLQTDVWYDIYAKAPAGGPTQGYSYIFATGIIGPLPVPPCCGNPVLYHIWSAQNFLDDVGPVGRNSAGGFHHSSANAQIPAGGTKWLMSVYVVDPANTARPADPVPVPPGGGGRGGGGWPFPFPDLGSLTPEQLLLIGGVAVVVIGVIALAAGGGDD